MADILFEVVDEVATITLNRPESRNALSDEMRLGLDDCLAEIRAEAGRGIKAAVITGAGRSFCAGGNVKGFATATDRTPISVRANLRSAHNRFSNILNLEVPLIAAVNGHAAGAGLALALMADFIMAGPSSRFVCSFGKIGLVPDWGGLYTLPRIVGLQAAKDMVFTNRQVGAEEAQKMGMVHEIYSDTDLVAQSQAFAGRFRHASTDAIGAAKVILNQAFNQDHRVLLEQEANGQGIVRTSEYHQKAVARFAAKEPALFDWEALASVGDAAE